MSEPKRPHGSRFREAPVTVSPGACGIAHSIVEARREHEPAERRAPPMPTRGAVGLNTQSER
jgi:hypothetical protein